jgi:succinyl-CoA synthetase beta subunit
VKIHEYQAMDCMARFGIPGPEGKSAATVDEALPIAQELLAKYSKIFIKAQVHAGGRGKAGGIKGARTMSEAETAIRQVLGMRLVTPQTGIEGKLVRKIAIVDGSQEIDRELYVSVILDRQQERPVIMASVAGGMEIEKIAAETPDLILKEHAHPLAGIQAFQARKLALGLGLKGDLFKQGVQLFINLYRMFMELDATQVEINPLAVTKSGRLWALDAKLNFDDSALFRHPDIITLRDLNEETPLEVEASKHGLNYIKLDGNIGCMVNGAGLAMATMDIIKHFGAAPANFLDVGGGASESVITEAFKILLADSDVDAVLVNIFGGIVRCDRVARGILTAGRRVDMDRPLIVRLVGTNAAEGNRLLQESGVPLKTASNMADAAQKVIAALEGR